AAQRPPSRAEPPSAPPDRVALGAPQLRPAEATVYSPTTLEHFRNPRNVGRLPNANAVGRVDDRETENLVAIYLRIEEGRVVAARFRTLGCSACIAASSMVTVLAQGRTLHDASTITAEAILEAL